MNKHFFLKITNMMNSTVHDYSLDQRYLQLISASAGLITSVWDSPCFTKNDKECTSGSREFLVETHQNFILQGSQINHNYFWY
jgi:hypothetical protein